MCFEQAFAAPAASLNGGDQRLRDALAAFFNTYFKPIHAVKPNHIVLTAGATDAIENIIHAVCDPGDYVLAPGPHWRKYLLPLFLLLLPVHFDGNGVLHIKG